MKKQNTEGSRYRRGELQRLVICAFFAAMSIVMGKYLAISVGEVLRFSFENLTIIMCGFIFGPAAGAVVGAVADLVGCLLVGYAINPILTVGAALIGFCAGLAKLLCCRRSDRPSFKLSLLFSVVSAHLVGSVIVKTVGLAAFYDLPLWELGLWRLLNYAVVGSAEYFILYYVLKNKAIASYVTKAGGKI